MEVLPISVMIRTLNRAEMLKYTVNCIMTKQFVPSQIVVIDQSDNDITKKTTGELAEKYKNITSVEYIHQEVPSATRARNTGMKHVKEEIVIVSDDDVEVSDDTLKNIYSLMTTENVAMVADAVRFVSKYPAVLSWLFGTQSFRNRKIGHVTKAMLGRYPCNIEGETETQWMMGYFFAVKKSIIEKWNIKWDENLIGYAYPEDLDFGYSYCRNAKKDGFKCVLSNTVKAKHLDCRECRSPSRKIIYMYVINRVYLSYKHKMGFISRAAILWCDFWRLIEKIIRRDAPMDLIKAHMIVFKHRKAVKEGNVAQFYINL